MKLRQQIANHTFDRPVDYSSRTVSQLIDHGLLLDLVHDGFPTYTPVGSILLEKVERAFVANARIVGFNSIRLPNAMRTDVLEKGQTIGKQFRTKLMHLTGVLEGHHVMCTPEMFLVEWARQYQLSKKQLPLNFYYVDELHRQMPRVKNSLISRQIRIFGGFVVEDRAAPQPGIDVVRRMVSKGFDEIGLPYHVEDDHDGFAHEFFYISPKNTYAVEGENLPLPGISKTARTKGFSMGMVYDYPMEGEWRMRVRNAQGKSEKPCFLTYGFCTHRILYCSLINSRDDKGFNLPAALRPFNISVIPESGAVLAQAEEIYETLSARFAHAAWDVTGNGVMLDDRLNRRVADRCDTADYIGVQAKVIVRRDKIVVLGRDEKSGTIFPDTTSFMGSQALQALRVG